VSSAASIREHDPPQAAGYIGRSRAIADLTDLANIVFFFATTQGDGVRPATADASCVELITPAKTFVGVFLF
jgi:hypothetical protein